MRLTGDDSIIQYLRGEGGGEKYCIFVIFFGRTLLEERIAQLETPGYFTHITEFKTFFMCRKFIRSYNNGNGQKY